MKKPTLDEIANMLETASLERWHYSVKSGEFESRPIDMDYADDDDDIERFDGEEYIPLPDQYDLNDYNIMRDFSISTDDPQKREILLTAISGRGAFRMFRHFIEEFGTEKEWYAFKFDAYREIARDWCKEYGIEYLGSE